MSTRATQRRPLEQGITLLEMLIVLGIIGAVMALGFFAIRSFTKTALRSDAGAIASALESAQDMAAQTGKHRRVVFALHQQTCPLEDRPDPIQPLRGAE